MGCLLKAAGHVANGAISFAAGAVNVAKKDSLMLGALATAVVAVDSYVLSGSIDRQYRTFNLCELKAPILLKILLKMNAQTNGSDFNCKNITIISSGDDYIPSYANLQMCMVILIPVMTGIAYRAFSKMEQKLNALVEGELRPAVVIDGAASSETCHNTFFSLGRISAVMFKVASISLLMRLVIQNLENYK